MAEIKRCVRVTVTFPSEQVDEIIAAATARGVDVATFVQDAAADLAKCASPTGTRHVEIEYAAGTV